MEFLTPEVFDALVFAAIIIGGTLAAIRLYRDFTRPLPPPRPQINDPFNTPTEPNKRSE
jgi:hypothetical protein